MNRLMSMTVVCVLSGAIAVPAASQGSRDDFVVVVNRASTVATLTVAELSKLFLRKQTRFPNGRVAIPVDQVESSPLRKRFSTEVHGMDVPSVKSYWQALVFSGRGEPPIERAADEDVMAFVRANPNAIGYVAAGMPLGDLKTVAIRRPAP